MNSKDKSWTVILSDPSIHSSFQSWLDEDFSIPFFEIPNELFTKNKILPVKTIPHYHAEELPSPLSSNHLELFRHKKGACVLTKTGPSRSLPSLFPAFHPCDIVKSGPFHNLFPSSLLFRNEIINEDNSFHLAQRMGVVDDFVSHLLGHSIDNLQSFGRFQGSLSSHVSLGSSTLSLDSALFENDHILENNDLIVILELKNKFFDSLSLHQLALPLLGIKNLQLNKKILTIYFENDGSNLPHQSNFRLYSLTFSFKNDILDLTSYKFDLALEYQIHY